MSGSNDPWWSGKGPTPPNVIVAVLCWLIISGLVAVFSMVSAQTAVGIGYISIAIGAIGLYHHYYKRQPATEVPRTR